MRSQALRADVLMLITAMIWGVSFVAQRLGMDAIGPFLYTGLRFVLGALVLVPLLMLRSRRDDPGFGFDLDTYRLLLSHLCGPHGRAPDLLHLPARRAA